MPVQGWESLANTGAPWQTASGATLSTAATATLSPEGAGGTGDDAQIYSFYQGMVIRVRARGIYTNGSTGTNATFALWASQSGTSLSGATGTVGASLATTGALALPTSVTNLWWRLDAYIQIRAMAQGSSTASVYTHGELMLQCATWSTPTGNVGVWPMPATSGPTAADIDTTLTHTIGLVGTLSQATGSPAITCTQFMLETIN